MASVLNAPYFHDEEAAFKALEGILWADGKPEHCPHCGVIGKANRLANQRSKASKRNPEGMPVYGLWKCYGCRKQFTVRKGTVFESSHLKLHQWFQAAFLMCSSKKGVSSNQLHRTLGCTLKTAWFVSHRLREAMRSGDLATMGGGGTPVESDETYIGRKRGRKIRRGGDHKMKVLTLIDRDTKQARSIVVNKINAETVQEIIAKNISREARLMTDEANHYVDADYYVAQHESVNHSQEEYVRGEVHTNTAEGFFSIFKRGMKGIYQHCQEKHLHRYMAEFDFRYNNRVALGIDDTERATKVLLGAVGKRLTYRDS